MMFHQYRNIFCIAAVVMMAVSCGDDPQLVEKRERQRAEIARLSGEVALIEERLKNLPPDVTKEVEEARVRADLQMGEVAKLEAEVAVLEARKAELQAEFEAYQAKYPIN